MNTPPLTDFRTGETGIYSVREDCTGMGELDFNVGGKGAGHGVHYLAFVISNGGRSIRAVSAGFSPPGMTTLVPDQTRVDFWKIGSERDDQ